MPKFIEWDGTYTPEQQAHINALKVEADTASFLAAVVDYLGFYDDGGWIDLTTAPERRFGVRSMSHVVVYKFPVVYHSKRSVAAGYGVGEEA